jgi:hypothetical protein
LDLVDDAVGALTCCMGRFAGGSRVVGHFNTG